MRLDRRLEHARDRYSQSGPARRSRNVFIGGDGGRVWLVATSAGYLAAGIAAFSLGESRAWRQGSLGRY